MSTEQNRLSVKPVDLKTALADLAGHTGNNKHAPIWTAIQLDVDHSPDLLRLTVCNGQTCEARSISFVYPEKVRKQYAPARFDRVSVDFKRFQQLIKLADLNQRIDLTIDSEIHTYQDFEAESNRIRLLWNVSESGTVKLPKMAERHHKQLTVAQSSYTSRLYQEHETDWQIVDLTGAEFMGTVQSEDLKRVIPRIVPYAAGADNRPVLMGVYFELQARTCQITACDGYRMRTTAINADLDKMSAFIVDAKALKTTAKNLPKTGGIRLYLQGEILVLETEDHKIMTAPLITGQYPDYRAIFPDKAFQNFARVSNNQLLLHAKNAKAYAKDSADAIRLDFPHAGERDGKITITARSRKHGDSIAEIFATSNAYGCEFCSLKVQYLIEACEKRTKQQMSWDKIRHHDPILTIGYKNASSPITIQNKAEHPNELTIIMPMSVGV